MTVDATELQRRIGSRVRARRLELGDTAGRLATRSGLSARFLADVESGKANISITRLAKLADALGVSLTSLLHPPAGAGRQAIDAMLDACTDEQLQQLAGVIEVAMGHRRPSIVALLGVRGAGKSTVGVRLAESLGLPFVELATRIEARAGMTLGDVFTLHGESYYRSIELECFVELVGEGTPCVVALPGGIVTSEDAMGLMRSSCASVWLQASAEDYWDRVFAQGDTRPMSGRTNAMADLRALLAQRRPLYEQADLVVDTSGIPPEQVVAAVIAGLEGAALHPIRGETS